MKIEARGGYAPGWLSGRRSSGWCRVTAVPFFKMVSGRVRQTLCIASTQAEIYARLNLARERDQYLAPVESLVSIPGDLIQGIKAGFASVQMFQNFQLLIQIHLLVQIPNQLIKIALHEFLLLVRDIKSCIVGLRSTLHKSKQFDGHCQISYSSTRFLEMVFSRRPAANTCDLWAGVEQAKNCLCLSCVLFHKALQPQIDLFDAKKLTAMESKDCE